MSSSMAEETLNLKNLKGRPFGSSEDSSCRCLLGGTGMAVITLLFREKPDISLIQTSLQKIQLCHPILRSKLHYNSTTNSFSYITYPKPFIKIQQFSPSSTLAILETILNTSTDSKSLLHLLTEYELKHNTWKNLKTSGKAMDMIFSNMYALPNSKWVIVIKLHVAASDRVTAMAVMRQFAAAMDGEDIEKESVKEEIELPIEKLIPVGKGKKAFWTRGMDLITMSLITLRNSTLKYVDIKSPQNSEVLRFHMDLEETRKVLDGCKSRGIRLSTALTAAALIAAHGSKRGYNHQKKYMVATIVDCRPYLHPSLSDKQAGLYHSAIANTHAIKGGEKLWDLAIKCNSILQNSIDNDKHLTDLADVNFLLTKAIENPTLSASAFVKATFLSVFDETVIEEEADVSLKRKLGIEDYVGCATLHGIGPSIALFDTIRGGRLDCVVIYPSPQHSRDQIKDVLDRLKAILLDPANYTESE